MTTWNTAGSQLHKIDVSLSASLPFFPPSLKWLNEEIRITNSFPTFFFSAYILIRREKSSMLSFSHTTLADREWLSFSSFRKLPFCIGVDKTTAQSHVWTTPSYRKPSYYTFTCLCKNYVSLNEAKCAVCDSPCV